MTTPPPPSPRAPTPSASRPASGRPATPAPPSASFAPPAGRAVSSRQLLQRIAHIIDRDGDSRPDAVVDIVARLVEEGPELLDELEAFSPAQVVKFVLYVLAIGLLLASACVAYAFSADPMVQEIALAVAGAVAGAPIAIFVKGLVTSRNKGGFVRHYCYRARPIQSYL